MRLLAVQGSHISLYGGGQFAYTHAGVQHLYCDAGGVSVTDLDVSGDVAVDCGGFVQNVRGVEGDTDRIWIENEKTIVDAGLPTEYTQIWTKFKKSGSYVGDESNWRIGLDNSWGMYFNESGFIISESTAFRLGTYDTGTDIGFISTGMHLGLSFFRWPQAWLADVSFR